VSDTETTEVDNPAGSIQESLNIEPAEEHESVQSEEPDGTPSTFPREVVEELRRENGKYRQRAQQADNMAERADNLGQRLHTELVRATGKLADPTDLPFDAEHLDSPEKLTEAIELLLSNKPHLATRKPAGDIGQGQRGSAAEPFSLLGFLKERT